MSRGGKKFLTPALAVCLFLLIVGAKWAVFERFGSPMPDWDQWDAEARELFIPWFEHDHFVQHLFHPHNEHRVILTKLQNLALGLLNGQWDSRLEAATNALLHAALGVAFWCCAVRWLRQEARGPRHKARGESQKPLPAPRASRLVPFLSAALFVVTAALFGLPLAWQNILGGFHSQQYWLLGLSFAAIVTLPFARGGSGAWSLGALCAVLALGSMGSGFLAIAMVAVVLGWRLFRRETTWRDAWPTLLLAALLIAIGLATRVEVPWHQNLKATSVREFCLSIERSLQWPLREHDWSAAVLWLPWALVAWRLIRGRVAEQTRAPETIVALGAWVLVQIAATAYARGVGADYPASRYMDTLAFGAMTNALALAWLARRPETGEERPETEDKRPKTRDQGPETGSQPSITDARQPVPGLRSLVSGLWSLVWLGTLVFGLFTVCQNNLRYELPDAKKYYRKAESVMSRYLATNDAKQLDSPDIPFPSAPDLVERLSHPSLRALMPLPIRAPLALTPMDTQAGAFVANDARGADPNFPPRAGLAPAAPPLEACVSWGSFGAAGVAATGEWRSQPLAAPLGQWLKFEIAGDLGPERDPQLGVALHDARSGAWLAEVHPDRTPGTTWRAAYVRAPRQPFVVVARDRSAQRWLAFSAPQEMGRLSYWAWRVTKHGLLLAGCAAGASAALGLVALGARRTTAARL